MRLSKLMAEKGLCSRREADEFIERGLVFVNGERVTQLGFKVDPNVSVTLDSDALKEQKNLVTVILNKPVGYVSAQAEDGYEPAIKLLTPENQWSEKAKRVFPLKFNDDQLKFILKEGKKRQIRRMCELVGLRVVGLKRVRVGQLRLGQLPEGQWRLLQPNEKI